METIPTWLEQAVMDTLQQRCPYNYHVNPKALKGIAKGLIRTNGLCPCTHDEWNDTTPNEDKECPCITFRTTGHCHCNLYHINEVPHRE